MVTNWDTFRMEKCIKERFSHYKSKVSEIPSYDLFLMMEGWLKTRICNNYDIHIIEMELFDNGLSISVQIEDIDDLRLQKCMRILGYPKDVYIGEDKKFYAHWCRNIVSWF